MCRANLRRLERLYQARKHFSGMRRPMKGMRARILNESTSFAYSACSITSEVPFELSATMWRSVSTWYDGGQCRRGRKSMGTVGSIVMYFGSSAKRPLSSCLYSRFVDIWPTGVVVGSPRVIPRSTWMCPSASSSSLPADDAGAASAGAASADAAAAGAAFDESSHFTVRATAGSMPLTGVCAVAARVLPASSSKGLPPGKCACLVASRGSSPSFNAATLAEEGGSPGAASPGATSPGVASSEAFSRSSPAHTSSPSISACCCCCWSSAPASGSTCRLASTSASASTFIFAFVTSSA